MDDDTAVYELNGQEYNTLSEFLIVLANEYKFGDQDAVMEALDKYGLDLSDIGE
ncbi:MAG TPA: hypothetical protein VFS65_01265 [Candidatus Saccharimonadales bacterium]|nr:hypothetical protein [Candidatus Saccharimonadales bacterium]